MSNNRGRLVVLSLLLVLVAFLVRVWGVAEVGLWHDEAISHFYASNSPGWIIRHCAGFINHPPLFFLLLRGWMMVVPVFDQWSVELMNVIIGSMTVGVLIRWADVVLSRTTAVVLGGLLALNAFHIYYSGELRMYALATFALTVSALFASRLLSREQPQFTDWAGWVLATLVSVYSHSFTALPVTFMVLFLGYRLIQRGLVQKFLTASAVILLAYAPWGVFVFRQARDITSGYWLPDFRWSYLVDLVMLAGGFVGPWVSGGLSWGVTIGVVLGFVGPMLLSLRGWDEDWVGLCWWMIAGPLILVVLISLRGQSVLLFRTYVVLLPVCLMLVGRGLCEMPKTVVVGVMVFYVGVLGIETVRLKANPPHQYARKVAQWIQEKAPPRAVVVHKDRFSFFPSYFYHKRRLDEFLLGAHPRRPFSIDRARVRRLNDRRPLFVVVPGDETDKIPRSWLHGASWRGRRSWSDRPFEALRIPVDNLGLTQQTSE